MDVVVLDNTDDHVRTIAVGHHCLLVSIMTQLEGRIVLSTEAAVHIGLPFAFPIVVERI